MDPNASLARIRELTYAVLTLDNLEEDVTELSSLIEALDEWISKGGFLPEEWAMKRQASIKPTRSQAEVIRYFATGDVVTVGRVNEATYRICRERGWIEPVDAFPFHRVTALGRAAIQHS